MILGRTFGCVALATLIIVVQSSSHNAARAQKPGMLDAQGQDEIILKRQTLMENIYDVFNEDELAEDPLQLQPHAATFVAQLEAFRAMFPPETNTKHPNYAPTLPTHALPAVWENVEAFSRSLDASIEAMKDLANARDPARYPDLSQRVLTTCDSCHNAFREPFDSPFDIK